MSKLPRVTIVTPTLNHAPFIEATLDSVLGQQYPNLEYIVIDGGSSDGTVDILKRYDKYLSYWHSQPDRGQADAINFGFQKSTGAILAWLNSDDYYLPRTIHTAVERLMSADGPALTYGSCILLDERNNTISYSQSRNFDRNQLAFESPLIQPSCFWTRTLWDSTGNLDIASHFTFDWEWFIRAYEHGTFFRLDDYLSVYRFHDDHKSSNSGAKRLEEIETIIDHHAHHEDKLLFHKIDNHLQSYLKRSSLEHYFRRVTKVVQRFISTIFFPGLRILETVHGEKKVRYVASEKHLGQKKR